MVAITVKTMSSAVSYSSVASCTSSSLASTKIVLEKITARVFCEVEGMGGNPITIFIPHRKDIINNLSSSSTSTSSSSIHGSNCYLSSKQQSQLAMTCSWESVFVNTNKISSSSSSTNGTPTPTTKYTTETNKVNNTMKFYMPSGNEVSFCAHAALGGSTVLSSFFSQQFPFGSSRNSNNTAATTITTSSINKKQGTAGDSIDSGTSTSSSSDNNEHEESIDFFIEPGNVDDNNITNTTEGLDDSGINTRFRSVIHHPHNIVSLEMNNILWKENPIEHPPGLHRTIRTMHGVNDPKQLRQKPYINFFSYNKKYISSYYPTFVNASILGRTKTLVYVTTMNVLNQTVQQPPSSKHYEMACDAIGTTGLYFYTTNDGTDTINSKNNIYEFEETSFSCRQFPRASGYPEDPATGIAAAALAVSLANRRLPEGSNDTITNVEDEEGMVPSSISYHFHQGHAMGKPSLIRIEDIRFADSSSSSSSTHQNQENDHGNNDDDDDGKKQTSDENSSDNTTTPEDEDDEEEQQRIQPRREAISRFVSFRIMGKVQIDNYETIEITVE